MLAAYYNDNDPYCGSWLANLAEQGRITEGVVDTRSIRDIQAGEMQGFSRCHFFAGIGGWEYALRLAGWPVDAPVWTGSCPCQPFSVAGKGKGTADERHLWPEFFRLIKQCRPPVIFGEQVASKAGREWLSGVFTDMETLGYAVAGADLCAAGVGAPHIRQRLYWVAYSERNARLRSERRCNERIDAGGCCEISRMDNSSGSRQQSERKESEIETRNETRLCGSEQGCSVGRLGDSNNARLEGLWRYDGFDGPEGRKTTERLAGASNFWSDYVTVDCYDRRTRRIESGLEPLVNGVPKRASKLRAYGNAIVPQIAAQFVRSVMEVLSEETK